MEHKSNKPVDVLAVMDRAANCAEAYEDTQKGLHAEHARFHRRELREARAAVAELVEAGKALSFAAQTTGGTAGRDETLVAAIDRFSAALARVGGAARAVDNSEQTA